MLVSILLLEKPPIEELAKTKGSPNNDTGDWREMHESGDRGLARRGRCWANHDLGADMFFSPHGCRSGSGRQMEVGDAVGAVGATGMFS